MKKILCLIKEYAICFILAFIIAVLLNKYVFYFINVPTGSMIPTIQEGDHFVVTRIHDYDKLKRGDIITFYSKENKANYVKRLIGLPGDKIRIDNGVVFVNGKRIKENYVKNKDDFSGYYEVPNNKYFFLGDNRTNSNDSRLWKNPYVDQKDLEGKVRKKIF